MCLVFQAFNRPTRSLHRAAYPLCQRSLLAFCRRVGASVLASGGR